MPKPDDARALLQAVLDYRRGRGRFNFSALPDDQRSIAALEAWEDIEDRIEAFMDTEPADARLLCAYALEKLLEETDDIST